MKNNSKAVLFFLTLSSFGLLANADFTYEKPYCEPSNIIELAVEKSVFGEPCESLSVFSRSEIIKLIDKVLLEKCSGQVEIIEDYKFSVKNNCWSMGPTVYKGVATFKCQKK